MSEKNTFHVALIPDGNRRWARARSLPVWKGHEAGARQMRALITAAFDAGATHVTLWGSSRENLTKRPVAERRALFTVYRRALQAFADECNAVGACFRAYGRMEMLPQDVREQINVITAATAHHMERTLTVLLAYSGDDEMLDAIARLRTATADVDDALVRAHLWTGALPPVDLMVRTGGEPHLSAGFLMWQMQNAHLHFTDTLFPDFTPAMFVRAIEAVRNRERRLGA